MIKLITSVLFVLIFISFANANIDSLYTHGINENDSIKIHAEIKVNLLNGKNIHTRLLRNMPGRYFYLGCRNCQNIKFNEINYIKVYDDKSILKGRILGTVGGVLVCIGLMALTPSSTKSKLRESGWGEPVGMAGLLSFGFIGYYGLSSVFTKGKIIIFNH